MFVTDEEEEESVSPPPVAARRRFDDEEEDDVYTSLTPSLHTVLRATRLTGEL